MKPSQVLREAARLVERCHADLGCGAIWWITSRSKRAEERAMTYFTRLHDVGNGPWWGNWETYERPEHHNARIIGLCLAAAIAESEGQ